MKSGGRKKKKQQLPESRQGDCVDVTLRGGQVLLFSFPTCRQRKRLREDGRPDGGL